MVMMLTVHFSVRLCLLNYVKSMVVKKNVDDDDVDDDDVVVVDDDVVDDDNNDDVDVDVWNHERSASFGIYTGRLPQKTVPRLLHPQTFGSP